MKTDETLYGIILNQDYIIRELLNGKLVKNIDSILDYTNEILSDEVKGTAELIELCEKQKAIIIDLDESNDVAGIDEFFEYSEDLIEQYDYLG